MLWKSKEVPAAQSAGSGVNTRSNLPKCLEFGTASEQVGRTYDDPRLEDLMVPSHQGFELIRAVCLMNSLLFKEHGLSLVSRTLEGLEKTKSEAGRFHLQNEAGSLSSLEPMNGCVRPGEMSDELLLWSLEKVFSSRSTPQGKESCDGVIKKGGNTSALDGAGQVRQSRKGERGLECG